VTTPRQAKKGGGDGPRMYAWPPQPPHEFEVISVTSALKALPKPFLIGWAAKVAAECAVEDHAVIGLLLAKGDKRAAVDHIKGARFRDMGKKADRGTIVHSAVELYLAGKPIDNDEVQARLEEKLVPKAMWKSAFLMISAVLQYLQDTEPEVYWSESTVYSREHGYAGTADILARTHVGGSRVPVVIDVKTSKSIYDEVALQLAGYARADFVGLDDGTEAPLIPDTTRKWVGGKLDPRGTEPIEYGVVVRPAPTGRYETATFALTDALYARFLAVLAVAKSEGLEAQCRRPS
jgi:hypothetical protein